MQRIKSSGQSIATVGAIIVTFNRPQLLERCIESIRAQQGVEAHIQIVVVDNASVGSASALLSHRFPDVTLISLAENTGPAGGFAEGIRFCKEQGYDWLWLFGDDTRAGPTLLAESFERVRALDNPHLGLLKPAAFTGSGSALKIMWRHRPVREAIPISQFCAPSDVFSFGGCLVPRSVVESIGLPDADLFMMMEEMDYCLRAQEAGYRNYTFPTASFEADAAGSHSSSAAWRGYYQSRNHLLMIRKRGRAPEFFWYWVRQLKFLLGIFINPANWKSRIYYRLLGIRDGLIGKTGRTVEPPSFPSEND